MSLELVNATLKSGVKPSSMRFVLLALSNYANEENEAYPSHKRISEDTGLDIKTVLKYFLVLESQGYLTDTGERKGKTKSTKVFHISIGKIISTPKNGAPPLFPVSTPKNGLTKHPQKRVTEPLVKNLKEPLLHKLDDFEVFYSAYPKKTDKKKTAQKWKRLTEEKKEKAHAGIVRFIAGKELKYICSPLVYLNGERWDDETHGEESNNQYAGYK